VPGPAGPPPAGFRQVGERVLHEGPVVSLRTGTFEAPDGQVVERQIVRHPGAVSAVAVDADGRVVLVRQYRAPLDAELLELPAGKLDAPGEDPLDCVRRELVEEVGLEAASWEPLVSIHHSPGFCDEVGHVFLARDLRRVGNDRQGVEEEWMTESWYLLADTPRMIAEGEITDAKTVVGLLLAHARSLA
jgi:8-oxo-dGTP pyrophosphatase MutT (NUDIX family)